MIRTLLTLVACFCISLLLYFSARILFVLTAGHPFLAALVFLPWMLGVCGLAGLLGAVRHEADKSLLWHKTVVVLLTLGIVGAACAIVLGAFAIAVYSFALGNPLFNGMLLLVLVFGIVLPVCLAVMARHRACLALKASARDEVPSTLAIAVPVIMLVCLAPLVRIAAQEIALLWYGRDLDAAILTAAERIADGEPYCLSDDFNGGGVAGLNKRQVLLAAIDKRYGFHGMNDIGPDPHFGIQVDGRQYWWSFRQRDFFILPGINFSHKFRHCR